MYRSYLIYSVNGSKEIEVPFAEGLTEELAAEETQKYLDQIDTAKIKIHHFKIEKVA